jgi:hypothetical protein
MERDGGRNEMEESEWMCGPGEGRPLKCMKGTVLWSYLFFHSRIDATLIVFVNLLAERSRLQQGSSRGQHL